MEIWVRKTTRTWSHKWERENGSPHVVVCPENTKKEFVVRIKFRRAYFLRTDTSTETSRICANFVSYSIFLRISLIFRSWSKSWSYFVSDPCRIRVGFVSSDSLVAEWCVVRTFFKTEMRGKGMNEEGSHNLVPCETISSFSTWNHQWWFITRVMDPWWVGTVPSNKIDGQCLLERTSCCCSTSSASFTRGRSLALLNLFSQLLRGSFMSTLHLSLATNTSFRRMKQQLTNGSRSGRLVILLFWKFKLSNKKSLSSFDRGPYANNSNNSTNTIP